MNVYDDPEHADAYDAYLERVGRMLKRGKGPAEIARYLGDVRTKAFARSENEESDEGFADRIIAWYAVEAPGLTRAPRCRAARLRARSKRPRPRPRSA